MLPFSQLRDKAGLISKRKAIKKGLSDGVERKLGKSEDFLRILCQRSH